MRLFRALLATTAGIAAVALAARAWMGPFEFGMSVHSPMNAASIFGAACVLLVFTSQWADSPALSMGATGPAMGSATASALLLGLLLAAAWPTLLVGFVADDYTLFAEAARSGWQQLVRGFTIPASGNVFFRPVALVSYWVDYHWAHVDPIRWHAAELTMHALNAILVFALGRKLRLSAAWALFAASVFAIHGSRPEAVTWVAARFDLLAAGFVLTALLLFVSYVERPRPWLLALMLVAALLGLLSKESAFVVPALMVIVAACRGERWWRNRIAVRAIAASGLLTLITFACRWAVVGGMGGYVDDQGRTTISTFNGPLALKALLFRMGAVLLVPINWTDPPELALRITLTLSLVAMLALAIRTRLDRLVLLGIAFTLVAALPVYHLLLIGPDLEKSRVVYLGSVGFALFLAAVTRNAPRGLGFAAAVAILAFHAAALRHNLATWDRVARIHLTACDYLGSEAETRGSIVVAGAPNTWDGVYMLKTGLPDCIAIRHGIAAANVHVVPDRPSADGFPGMPAYAWDDATARMARWK
jgi:hypothetical protein